MTPGGKNDSIINEWWYIMIAWYMSVSSQFWTAGYKLDSTLIIATGHAQITVNWLHPCPSVSVSVPISPFCLCLYLCLYLYLYLQNLILVLRLSTGRFHLRVSDLPTKCSGSTTGWIMVVWWSGAHCTNICHHILNSIEIHFIAIQLLVTTPQQIFAQGTKAQLSCHVQIFVAIAAH